MCQPSLPLKIQGTANHSTCNSISPSCHTWWAAASSIVEFGWEWAHLQFSITVTDFRRDRGGSWPRANRYAKEHYGKGGRGGQRATITKVTEIRKKTKTYPNYVIYKPCAMLCSAPQGLFFLRKWRPWFFWTCILSWKIKYKNDMCS